MMQMLSNSETLAWNVSCLHTRNILQWLAIDFHVDTMSHDESMFCKFMIWRDNWQILKREVFVASKFHFLGALID